MFCKFCAETQGRGGRKRFSLFDFLCVPSVAALSLSLHRRFSVNLMRFCIGSIPEDSDFQPTPPVWHILREPHPGWMQLVALPFSAVGVLITQRCWVALAPAALKFEYQAPASTHVVAALVGVLGVCVASFVLLIVVHEGIHALVHPGAGRSPHSMVGAWPRMLLFYAHYLGEMSRTRFIAILLMPFLVLSPGLALLAAALSWPSPVLAAFSLLNALSAGGDLFAVSLLLWQVPPRAITRNRGWKTYWREP